MTWVRWDSRRRRGCHFTSEPCIVFSVCWTSCLARLENSHPVLFVTLGGVQLICNNMVTSTRAIVNTARSMVSTIMKFLDSGPNKAADSALKTRILPSEPDNAEGIHNFAPLGKKILIHVTYG